MAFIYTWDASFLAQPANTEAASLGAGRIRDLKAAIGERMAVDHSLAGDAEDGKHLKVTLKELTSDPTNVAATGFLYVKDVGSGVIELFYEDAAGNVKQLTNAGSLSGPMIGNVTGNVTGDVTGNATTATTATNAVTVVTTVASAATGTTQAAGTNNTQMATTAFVTTAVATGVALAVPKDAGVIGVGTILYARPSGTTVAANGTLAGSSLLMAYESGGGWVHTVIGSGTWRNISVVTATTSNSVPFQRIS